MNLGKVVFDPGHYAGANKYNNYSEGDVMLKLALKLKEKGFSIIREDGNDITLLARVRKAVALGADTLISLHTDWIPPDDPKTVYNESKRTEGVMPIYSLNISEDKAIAEELGRGLANAMGITFNKLYTRHASRSTLLNPLDWYGILRHGVRLGLKHVLIIEHCNHAQMAINTDRKIDAIVDYYTKIFKGDKSDEDMVMDKSFVQRKIIIANVLNVREKPDAKAKDIGDLLQDQIVEITGQVGKWYRIPFNERDAYVHSDYTKDYVEPTLPDYKSENEKLKKLNGELIGKITAAKNILM